MNTNFLGGDIYLTFLIGAVVEIPANLAIYFLIDRIGRKAIVMGGFTICALALGSNLLINALGVGTGD